MRITTEVSRVQRFTLSSPLNWHPDQPGGAASAEHWEMYWLTVAVNRYWWFHLSRNLKRDTVWPYFLSIIWEKDRTDVTGTHFSIRQHKFKNLWSDEGNLTCWVSHSSLSGPLQTADLLWKLNIIQPSFKAQLIKIASPCGFQRVLVRHWHSRPGADR